MTDLADLAGLSIGGPLNLVWTPLGKGNAKHTDSEIISSFDINMSFDQRLPLTNKGPQFVGSEVHTLNI